MTLTCMLYMCKSTYSYRVYIYFITSIVLKYILHLHFIYTIMVSQTYAVCMLSENNNNNNNIICYILLF